MKKGILITAVALLIAGGVLTSAVEAANILGYVYYKGALEPLAWVNVTQVSGGNYNQTRHPNDYGVYSFGGMDVGNYEINAWLGSEYSCTFYFTVQFWGDRLSQDLSIPAGYYGEECPECPW
jgi:hypothetical protein